MQESYDQSPSPSWAQRQGTLRTFLFWAVPVLIGLGVALAIQVLVIFPRLGAGAPDVQRCIELGQRIEEGLSDAPTVVFIGDSVTVEGIDAGLVQHAAPPGWRILNLSLNGGDRLEQAIMIPKLAQARPAVVVWIVRPMLLGAPPGDLNEDRAAAYRLACFPGVWPDQWLTERTAGLNAELLGVLQGSALKTQVHFRSAFVQVAGVKLKERLRPGEFRAAAADDWTAPYVLSAAAPPDRLRINIEHLMKEHDQRVRTRTKDEQGQEVVTSRVEPVEFFRLVDHLANQGARVVLVRAPIHPEIRGAKAFEPEATQLETMASEWCVSHGGLYLDAADLLVAEEFADGQHPAASGRAKLSAYIGSKLPVPGGAARGEGN